MDAYTSSTTKTIYKGTQIVWYIYGILEALLIFRFVLKLLGANTGAGFTQFVYSATYPFVQPFISVFSTTRVDGSSFEWVTILAMVVYWLVATAIIRLFLMGKTVSTPEAAVKLEEQEVNNK
jgi:hypothetical protein